MRKSGVRASGWAAVMLLALAFRLASWRHVDPAAGTNPFDGDCQYHRLRAEQIAAHFPHVSWTDPMLGDGGIDIPWPPLFDEIIAFAAVLASDGVPSPEAVARAAAWAPVIIGIATIPLVGWLAGILVGPELSLGAALLLTLSAPHAYYSLLGRSDQHVLELLLTVLILIAYARALSARTVVALATASAALGITLALAFWNWQGSALNLLFLAVFVSAWHVLAGRGAGWAAMPATALSLGCGVGAALLAGTVWWLGPPGALATGTISGISGLHVALTAGTGLFAAALWGARTLQEDAGPGQRLGEVVAAGTVVLASLALHPGVREGISHGLQALLKVNPWYASIEEFQPALFGGYHPLSQEVIADFLLCGLTPAFAVAGAVALLDRWRHADERARAAVLLLATWGIVAFALALARKRFSLYAAPPLAMWGWMGIRHAQERWVRGLSRGALGAAFVSTTVAAAVAAPVIQLSRSALRPDAISPGPLLAWMRDRPDPTGAPVVYANWMWGHHVRALAGRPAVANPFGTEGGAVGFDESLRVFVSTDEEEVERVLWKRRAGYLLVQDPRSDVLSYQDSLEPGRRVAKVSSSWRTGRTMVANDSYRTMVTYRLHFHDGAAADGRPALGRFRLLRETQPAHVEASLRPAYALFGFVRGARLAVTGLSPGGEVMATVAVRANTGREFTWWTAARADGAGAVVLRVPYATGENGSSFAGPFEVSAGMAKRVVEVSEDAVVDGREIQVPFVRSALAARAPLAEPRSDPRKGRSP